MLSGAEVAVNTATFKNDPAKIASKDDVITYLIHLGYLGYNEDSETAFIPNEEIRQELITAVKSSNWNELIGFQEESRKLLMATLAMDAKRVAAQIEKIHSEFASSIRYNDENSLSSTRNIALRLRTGGFALSPRNFCAYSAPALFPPQYTSPAAYSCHAHSAKTPMSESQDLLHCITAHSTHWRFRLFFFFFLSSSFLRNCPASIANGSAIIKIIISPIVDFISP